MRVLIACECSGIVRDEFRARGHDAWSCDLFPALDASPYHIEGDCRETLDGGWDMMIAHPPCTYLTSAGARWWRGREELQTEAVSFARCLYGAPIPKIAIENPVGRLSTAWRPPDQIAQPWWFGETEVKAICLWLKGLPLLVPTNPVSGPYFSVHSESPSPIRWLRRSVFFVGVAEAMAEQWGTL